MADTGFGITISWPVSGFTAQIIDVNPPNVSADDVDVTHMQSSGGIREFIAGLIDNGALKCTILYDPSKAIPVGDVSPSAQRGTTTITFPGGETWAFSSYINSYEPKTPIDDKMTADISVKVSGRITITGA